MSRNAWRIPLLYLVFGVVWILGSSGLLYLLAPNPRLQATIEGCKGLAFIVVSALWLRLLIDREANARRDSEAAVHSSHQLFSRIFELSPIPTCITVLADGTYLEVNESYARTLGYQPKELIGKSSLRIGTHVEPARRREIVQALLDGKPINGEPLVYRAKDGRQHHGFASCETLHYDGQLCVLTVFHDDTERLDSAATLRADEEQYRAIFEANPLPMWVYDRHTLAFLDVNEAAVRHYGYSREEFLGMTIEAIRPRQGVPPLQRYMAQLEAGGDRQYNMRLWQHCKKDGTLIEVEIISHNIDFQGKSARLVLAYDVTDRLQAEV